MKTERLSSKEFRKRHPEGLLGWHGTTENGEHVIEVPYGASTRTRMHEIAHAELGHKTEEMTFGDWAKRELAADAWVAERLGKGVTMAEVCGDFQPMAEEAFRMGYTVSNVMTWLMEELSGAGYSLDRGDRSTLWWLLRRWHEEAKRK